MGGALPAIRHAKQRWTVSTWVAGIMSCKPTKVAAMALANKNAHRVGAVLMSANRHQRVNAQEHQFGRVEER